MITTDQSENLYQTLQKLKQLKRAGWVNKGVAEPESVAEHSYSLSVLALFCAKDSTLDIGKLLAMTLLHDIGESIIGDITPRDGVSAEDKSNREIEAVKSILSEHDSTGTLFELWLDFELRRTPEAVLVGQLDKLDAYLQARQYKLDSNGLAEFAATTRNQLSDPDLIKLLDELEKTAQDTA
jgi:putative hydrolase of HD superfamily